MEKYDKDSWPRYPDMWSWRRFGGHIPVRCPATGPTWQQRGKYRNSSLSSLLIDEKKADRSIDPDTQDKLRYRRLEHFDSGAREFMLSLVSTEETLIYRSDTYANDACGATNASSLILHLLSILAVRLLLPSCTNRLISKFLTIFAQSLFFKWALIEGHIVLTNDWKVLLFLVKIGLRYKYSRVNLYHSRETNTQEWRVVCESRWSFECEKALEERTDNICTKISTGRSLMVTLMDGSAILINRIDKLSLRDSQRAPVLLEWLGLRATYGNSGFDDEALLPIAIADWCGWTAEADFEFWQN